MPVYLDVSSTVHSKAGMGRYAESLARALVDLRPDRFALFFNRGPRTQLPVGLNTLPSRSIRAGYKPWRMAVWIGQLLGVGFDALLPGATLFHATEHLLPPLRAIPTVLTVHDMIFKLFPEHQKRLNYWYLNATMPLYCRRANAIVTVTECSKRDIVEEYGLDPAKITVIHEAASPEFSAASPEAVQDAHRRYRLPERFLLHVGTIEPRKNLLRLVEALQLLHSRGLRIPLVLVGAKGWLYDRLFRRLEELDVRHSVYLTGYVPADDLPVLYSAATAVVMPSVYEGFGLPVLEAMACGTPVISSHASSLPEVGGGAAYYFDPHNVEAIADALAEVWSDGNLRAEMRRQGLCQAAGFSWARAAEETLQVYNKVLAVDAML